MRTSERARAIRQFTLVAAMAIILTVGAAAPALAQSGGPAPDSSRAEPAPLQNTDDPNAVPDRYIVVFDRNVAASDKRAARDDAKAKGAQVHHEYSTAINGFAATLSPEAVDRLRHNKHVAFIEADRTVTVLDTQTPATWGLDRIDQRNLPLSSAYAYNTTGTGVKAYVIDTGILFTHDQFAGRATSGFDSVDGGAADDCNGHGTHVAGTIGGSTYGVAKAVQLVAVRVLNCQGSGTSSGVIAGIDWVTADHQAGQPAVANMSLGGGADTALDTAVQNSIADGVTYAIAAGNSNANACNASPARVAPAITVGATTSTDARSSFSNYGTCVDVFAPGSGITSAWNTSNSATNTISGTSMATPHVAGAAALYLQDNPTASPQAVRDQLVNSSTPGVVTSPGSGSPNRLLYTLGDIAPPPPPPPPPTGCAAYPSVFTATLTGTGDSDIHPNDTYFYSAAGTHKGCLDGPNGVNFNLRLYRWNGSWVQVAAGTTAGPDELVTYQGSAGYYYWKVVSKSGRGTYTFGMQRP